MRAGSMIIRALLAAVALCSHCGARLIRPRLLLVMVAVQYSNRNPKVLALVASVV